MSRLDSALARFSEALEALDRVVQTRLAADDALPAAERQIATLKADKAQLETELARLTAERRRLEGLNDHVAGRLDATIRDLRTVLAAEAAE
jgi:predicted  nucleic acid-binding Zn-ribbon protein